MQLSGDTPRRENLAELSKLVLEECTSTALSNAERLAKVNGLEFGRDEQRQVAIKLAQGIATMHTNEINSSLITEAEFEESEVREMLNSENWKFPASMLDREDDIDEDRMNELIRFAIANPEFKSSIVDYFVEYFHYISAVTVSSDALLRRVGDQDDSMGVGLSLVMFSKLKSEALFDKIREFIESDSQDIDDFICKIGLNRVEEVLGSADEVGAPEISENLQRCRVPELGENVEYTVVGEHVRNGMKEFMRLASKNIFTPLEEVVGNILAKAVWKSEFSTRNAAKAIRLLDMALRKHGKNTLDQFASWLSQYCERYDITD